MEAKEWEKLGLASFDCLLYQQLVCFGSINCTGEISIFQALSNLLGSVSLPALKVYSDWGELSKSPSGKSTKEEFIQYADDFIEYLKCKLFSECVFIYSVWLDVKGLRLPLQLFPLFALKYEKIIAEVKQGYYMYNGWHEEFPFPRTGIDKGRR